MDHFKLTLHALADDHNCLHAGMLATAEAELNDLRKTHLLYQTHFVGDGRALVCLWVKMPEPPTHMPLGYAVV